MIESAACDTVTSQKLCREILKLSNGFVPRWIQVAAYSHIGAPHMLSKLVEIKKGLTNRPHA
jgi:flagellar biosynthesis protein FliQ